MRGRREREGMTDHALASDACTPRRGHIDDAKVVLDAVGTRGRL